MKLALALCFLASLTYAQPSHRNVGRPHSFSACNTVVLTTPCKESYAQVTRVLADEAYIVIGNRDQRSIAAMGSTQQPSLPLPLDLTLYCFVGDSSVTLWGTYLPPIGHAGRLAPLVNKGQKGSYNIIAWTEVERLVGVLTQALQATKVQYFARPVD